MKNFVLGLVLCGFASLSVGCGDAPAAKKDAPKTDTKAAETKPADKK